MSLVGKGLMSFVFSRGGLSSAAGDPGAGDERATDDRLHPPFSQGVPREITEGGPSAEDSHLVSGRADRAAAGATGADAQRAGRPGETGVQTSGAAGEGVTAEGVPDENDRDVRGGQEGPGV